MPAPRTQAPLALTMGEPGGCGPEITLAAWRQLRHSGHTFFLLADPAIFDPAGIVEIARPQEAKTVFAKGVPLLPLSHRVMATPGIASPANAAAVIESIERAVGFALSGAAAGIITNPIQKSTLIAAGFKFPGHTEFLADLAKSAPMPEGRTRGPVMMIAGPVLKTVPVTIHISVREAAHTLNTDMIEHAGRVVAEALRSEFGIASPRLAISGLNPHAGEQGAIGAEDDAVIAPAIAALKAAGIDARGPLPADTMFHEEARAAYDAALCMLHDQALIPAKTLSFHEAVNVTLGLPIVRTSPDHGTALDIAGRAKARADSLIAAINLAGSMAARRAQ
ncbi:4-hydroxythreonine-4-phosphate dehydrogenase PdxA [Hyphococcus sp.]|uniref:4-hydroxythreonine-4-phosphate dehydrogenase PdxA n=1 Tax=Hyphococcus sp. TaxID=2038636 RepID=UPI0020868CB2|nr:MAG: 4-hydroxythreonine-4-phosphate dehydrogenase [Marinicaulis sp.]